MTEVIIHRDRGDGHCEWNGEKWPCLAVRQTRVEFLIEQSVATREEEIDVG